jgi:hypothetical protein
MKSQLLVIVCLVVTMTSIATLLMNTNLGNVKAFDNSTRGNSTSIQEAKLYVDDAIQSLQQTQDTKTSIALLKLADQRLGTLIQPILGNATKSLDYVNSTYGIKMQYGSDWGVQGTGSSPVIATFFPQRNNPGNVIVDVAINDLNTNLTAEQYLNKLMHEIANPNLKFTIHTTNNVTLANHPGFLLSGTFKRNSSSNALEWFSNIGTIIGNKVYSILYYSPEKTYPVYHPTYLQMIRSFELTPPYMCPAYIVCYPITP